MRREKLYLANYLGGILYLADFARFSSINGIRLNHSRDILLEGLIFINPPHYTVSLGDCEDVTIRNIKSFSCEGWSDGVDMMSSRRVLVEDCFLRTSDDCVAIYGSRWDNYGAPDGPLGGRGPSHDDRHPRGPCP